MPRTTRRWIGLATGILLILAVGAVLVVSQRQATALLHHPPEERAAYLRDHPELDAHRLLAEYGLTDVAEPMILQTEDGLSLTALYIPSTNGAGVVVVPGYKDPGSSMIHIAAMLARHGYGVIIPELRAHGGSDGDIISFGQHEMLDLSAAFKYLTARPDVNPQRIGILGNSMGGALAINYAAINPDIRAVVAQSPYASVDNTVAVSVHHFTGLPSFPFANLILFFVERKLSYDLDGVSPLNFVHRISTRPVFLMMGGKDGYVNPEGGRLLYEAAGEPRELWFEPDLGHVEFSTRRAAEFEARVTEFFDRYMTVPQAGR